MNQQTDCMTMQVSDKDKYIILTSINI